MQVKIRYGYANSLEKEVTGGTYAQLLGDPNLKAVLGYGCNFQALDESRRVINLNHPVRPGVITIEAIASTKGADGDVTVDISYGYGNKLTKSYPAGTTVGSVLSDRNLQVVLGFPANSKALIDRVEQPADAPLQSGDSIVIETVASTKGQ